ncbi:MAG: hypothetical protein WC848_06315 [Parcubacteria group bacterium]|jgi:hypothetical protein
MKKIITLGTLSMALLFLTGCGQSRPNNPDTNQPVNPPQVSGKCGMENCHGLDITCGPNTSAACDSMYAFGDNCRQYASCQTINGECKLQKTAKFDTCKSCVEKCAKTFPNDSMKNAECESNCTE